MNDANQEELARTGVLNLGQLFDGEELDALLALFDADRANFRYFWHRYGHHQEANYDALITTPAPLANDACIPATLWRDHADPEARAFYGVLNRRTKLYLAAFGG